MDVTRRRVLDQAMLGLTVGLAAVSGVRHVAAREATPAGVEKTALLFVQLARGGTFAPDAADPVQATLTLEEVWPEIVYFSDRPQRLAGTIATAAWLEPEGLFDPADPPNAAVVLSAPDSANADVIIVELRDPVYDPLAGTLRYAVRVLDKAPAGLAAWAERADRALPSTFAQVAVFIDLVIESNRGPQAENIIK